MSPPARWRAAQAGARIAIAPGKAPTPRPADSAALEQSVTARPPQRIRRRTVKRDALHTHCRVSVRAALAAFRRAIVPACLDRATDDDGRGEAGARRAGSRARVSRRRAQRARRARRPCAPDPRGRRAARRCADRSRARRVRRTERRCGRARRGHADRAARFRPSRVRARARARRAARVRGRVIAAARARRRP